MNFLGIDIGTSAVKAVLVDENQAILGEASTPIATAYRKPGWCEQDPEAWWQATLHVLAILAAQDAAAFAAIRAIGLSGQMHGAVILDETDAVIRPAILWNDRRAVAECAELEKRVPNLAMIAGVVPMPGFTAPKLRWIGRNEPENFARIRTVLLAKDYVRLRLTGEFATDMADAAGTLLLDEAARRWAEPAIAATRLDPSVMPRLLEGPAWSGMVRSELLAAWGIGHQVVVAARAADIPAGAIGVGAINEGDAFVSLGTSAQIFVARNRYAPRPQTLLHAFAHGLPDRWFEMAALLNGATTLDWLAGLLGERDAAGLVRRVEAGFQGPSGVLFLPYLAGERTPLNDPDARGVFANLDQATGPTDLALAVVEGVALAIRDAETAFGGGLAGGPIAMIGGATRSRLWMKVVASALGRPLLRLAGADVGPVFGAARLARMAATGEEAATVCTQPPIVEIVDPQPSLEAAYAERLGEFRALYRSLKRTRSSR
ncbi:MAG: xylulokinase [Bauldia sp.]